MHVSLLAIQISVIEIVIFQIGALVLGFLVHYFWNIRNGSQFDQDIDVEKFEKDAHGWRIKYYNVMEQQKKPDEHLSRELLQARENEQLLADEIEELKEVIEEFKQRPLQQLVAEASSSVSFADITPAEYLVQLKSAQDHLLQHNQNISKLLSQVDLLEKVEQKHLDTMQQNQYLTEQLQLLHCSLTEKEGELNTMRQQTVLTQEMKNRLETACDEFNEIQSKLMKVGQQLTLPQTHTLLNNELEEANHMQSVELNEMRTKQREQVEENSRLSQYLIEMESKLKESNLQRQQLTKRNDFLEELNKDLQQVSDHNKKLESQLSRLSEIEVMLARISAG